MEDIDLRSYLREHGMLDADQAVTIAHGVAMELGAAHRRGIVHCDIKPQNILIGSDGSIKLTGFTSVDALGTVQYSTPEYAKCEIISAATDVYALGIVLYEMLTGRVPFDGDNPVVVAMQHIQDIPIPPSQLNPMIPSAMEEIVLRCLEKIPEMRFRDGSQLTRALETLSDG